MKIVDDGDEMREEYDFTHARRTNKYADMYAEGTNVVLLDPDLVEAFPDSRSVNKALRVILEASQSSRSGNP